MDDILAMIHNEIADFEWLEQSFHGSSARAEEAISEEQSAVNSVMKALRI